MTGYTILLELRKDTLILSNRRDLFCRERIFNLVLRIKHLLKTTVQLY